MHDAFELVECLRSFTRASHTMEAVVQRYIELVYSQRAEHASHNSSAPGHHAPNVMIFTAFAADAMYPCCCFALQHVLSQLQQRVSRSFNLVKHTK